MGRIDVDLPKELEKRFRQAIFTKSGGKKGGLAKAVIEALELWLAKKS